jgi:hypothetical protein
MIDLKALDLPFDKHRSETQKADIDAAWDIVGVPYGQHLLNSTEGHLAVVRAIQYGRQQRETELRELRRLHNDLKVELASRSLRIQGLEYRVERAAASTTDPVVALDLREAIR